MRRVAIVTGSRAEYGLLSPLIDQLNDSQQYDVQLVVCAMHLLAEFGDTRNEIKKHENLIAAEVDMLLANDTPEGIAKSVGLGVIEFASQFKRLQPDALIVLGDRFETFAAVQAAFIAHLPVIHLHGGELSFGALDESFRHAITKFSHCHFVACESYRQRVIQMGEQPARVYNTGAIGLDNIKNMSTVGRAELCDKLGICFSNKNILITIHPGTIDPIQNQQLTEQLFSALRSLKETTMIFTKSNADEGGRAINDCIEEFCRDDPASRFCFASLGNKNYLSLLNNVDAVVGNSSSGIIEAPFCQVPTVNIGDRQQGRLQAPSIINCEYESDEINAAIQLALSHEFKLMAKQSKGLFGSGDSAQKMAEIMDSIDFKAIIKKEFFDMEVQHATSTACKDYC